MTKINIIISSKTKGNIKIMVLIDTVKIRLLRETDKYSMKALKL